MEGQIRKLITDLMKEMEGTLTVLESRESDIRKKLAKLPQNLHEYTRFNRDIKLNEDIYSMLLTKYEETRIKSKETSSGASIVGYALESQKIEESGNLSRSGTGAAIWLTAWLLLGYGWRVTADYRRIAVRSLSNVRIKTSIRREAPVLPAKAEIPEISPVEGIAVGTDGSFTFDIVREAERIIDAVEYNEDMSDIETFSGDGADLPIKIPKILKFPDSGKIRPPDLRVEFSDNNSDRRGNILISKEILGERISSSGGVVPECSIYFFTNLNSIESERDSKLSGIIGKEKQSITGIYHRIISNIMNNTGHKRKINRKQPYNFNLNEIEFININPSNIGDERIEYYHNPWVNKQLLFSMEDVREKISSDLPEAKELSIQAVSKENDLSNFQNKQIKSCNNKHLSNGSAEIVEAAEKLVEEFCKSQPNTINNKMIHFLDNSATTDDKIFSDMNRDLIKIPMSLNYNDITNLKKLENGVRNRKILDNY